MVRSAVIRLEFCCGVLTDPVRSAVLEALRRSLKGVDPRLERSGRCGDVYRLELRDAEQVVSVSRLVCEAVLQKALQLCRDRVEWLGRPTLLSADASRGGIALKLYGKNKDLLARVDVEAIGGSAPRRFIDAVEGFATEVLGNRVRCHAAGDGLSIAGYPAEGRAIFCYVPLWRGTNVLVAYISRDPDMGRVFAAFVLPFLLRIETLLKNVEKLRKLLTELERLGALEIYVGSPDIYGNVLIAARYPNGGERSAALNLLEEEVDEADVLSRILDLREPTMGGGRLGRLLA